MIIIFVLCCLRCVATKFIEMNENVRSNGDLNNKFYSFGGWNFNRRLGADDPTSFPSQFPSVQPSIEPTNQPTRYPRQKPTMQPIRAPTEQPSKRPLHRPTKQPIKRLRILNFLKYFCGHVQLLGRAVSLLPLHQGPPVSRLGNQHGNQHKVHPVQA